MSKDTPDFKNEFSEIETMMNSIGAEVVIARKGYCELAGRGTEHAWSSSKDLFRKENSSLTNEHRAADLKSRTQFSWKKYPLKRQEKVPEEHENATFLAFLFWMTPINKEHAL